MSRHRDEVYLAHMRDFAMTAGEISQGKNRGQLDTDKMLRYALLHLVTILGEAASKVSSEFRMAHKEIPWGSIIGTRNRLVHGYDVVDLDMLWETVEKDPPELHRQLYTVLDGRAGTP